MGYYQVPLEESSKARTAFITHNGKYEFTCLPFGTQTASGQFQKMVQTILRGSEKFAESFIDDIVIFSNDFESHVKHLENVFSKLIAAGLTAKPSKCKIGHAQVPYLGHLVGHGTVRPLQAKYVPDYSKIASPLTDLTKGPTKQCKIKWSEECEESFQSLKRALMCEPVLMLPDFDQTFIVQVDASERALGAVLSQLNMAGDEHPVCYASRKWLPSEQSICHLRKGMSGYYMGCNDNVQTVCLW